MLPTPAVPPLVRGPIRAAQFVVEIVGPRTVPAIQAANLLHPDWRAALGGPEMWVMGPADTAWRPLRNETHGSYDSIALAWDLVTPLGEMSATSAGHLVALAERFANPLGRRAIPLTAPGDLAREIRRLRAAQDSLDAGVSIILVAPRPAPVSEYARELERLGLVEQGGEWRWIAPGHPEPMFEATPFDAPTTDGLTLGFRLARCPDPAVALEGMLNVADALARTGLALFDEDRRRLTPDLREAIRRDVRTGAAALTSAGLAPGSWAALKAFV